MYVVKELEEKVGVCQICGINVYDRRKLNKTFVYLGRERMGYPKDIAMPCGINRSDVGRCPFESQEEQDKINYDKSIGIFSGENNWDKAL